MGKPGMLQSMGSQRVTHDWVTEQQSSSHMSLLSQAPGTGLLPEVTIKHQLSGLLFRRGNLGPENPRDHGGRASLEPELTPAPALWTVPDNLPILTLHGPAFVRLSASPQNALSQPIFPMHYSFFFPFQCFKWHFFLEDLPTPRAK